MSACTSTLELPDAMYEVDVLDKAIIFVTQTGLPIVPRPYHAVAEMVGISPEEVMIRFRRMLEAGVIRRIGAVPNHYRLGYCANGMSVWDIPDEKIATVGPLVGALSFVSHCYHRPRALPEWPYNLFAMVHGRTKDDVQRQVDVIAALLGPAARNHTVLYSTRILKKTGLRIA